MPARFRQWVEDAVSNMFQWPSNTAFGNAFKYLYEQYISNVKTNIRTHCERRLTKYFRMCVHELNDHIIRQNNPNAVLFTGVDVKNAVSYTYKRRDRTAGDVGAQHRLGVLLDELRACHAPQDCNILAFINDENWFRSIRMWLRMQRNIQLYNLAYANVRDSWNLFRKYPLYVQQPTAPEPPVIANFTAIPMCSFQRRHIRICTDVLYNLLCKAGKVPKKCGKRKDTQINFTQNDFRINNSGSWHLYFDIGKIVAMVKGKRTFDYEIISDGVSVTMQYVRRIRPAAPESNEDVLRDYEAGAYWYELGIDPGMRTWNATVRKDIRTGEEVSKFTLIRFDLILIR